MGAAVHGECYVTAQEAGAALCATYPLTVVRADGVAAQYSCTGVSGDGLTLSLQGSDGTGASATVPLTFAYAVCDETASHGPFDLSREDGLQITALILAVWVSAFVARALIRVLQDRSEEA